MVVGYIVPNNLQMKKGDAIHKEKMLCGSISSIAASKFATSGIIFRETTSSWDSDFGAKEVHRFR